MVETRRAYFDGPHGQIHAWIAGQARPGVLPLFCAHQSPKHGGEFSNFMKAAAQHRLVVAPDYPGYGMSDTPPDESDVTIEYYADAMWSVIDQMGHEKVDLFGNHTGSKVIAAMAMARPERVGSLVMISATILTPEEHRMFSDYFQPVPLDEAGTRFTTMWSRIVERRGPGATLEMMARSFAMNLMGGEAYEWGHHAAFAWWKEDETALRTLEDPSLSVDVFVTDVVMPGMDGPSWVREALKDRPETRVVFVSGYAEGAFGGAQPVVPNSVFLPKPFSLNQLTETVHRQLH